MGDDSASVVISGDDILIEYCERIRHALRQVADARVRPSQQAQLIRFITHYVWQMADKAGPMAAQRPKAGGGAPTGSRSSSDNLKGQVSFHTRVANRIKEMKERRKRLIRMQQRSEAGSAQNNFA
mmetsp:Transcript_32090/g.42565  ORF Transcript_32090/g.42565 Transcript_32090/m.42565 type:complete len:125 (+) Transcript_32090:439-813(+)